MAVVITKDCTFKGCGKQFSCMDSLIRHIESIHLDFSQKTQAELERSQPETIPLSYILKYSSLNPIKGSKSKVTSDFTSKVRPPFSVANIASEEIPPIRKFDGNSKSWCNFHPISLNSVSFAGELMHSRKPITKLLKRNVFINTLPKEKPFVCMIPGCKKSYKNINGIKYHYKNVHQVDDFNSLNHKARRLFNRKMLYHSLKYANKKPICISPLEKTSYKSVNNFKKNHLKNKQPQGESISSNYSISDCRRNGTPKKLNIDFVVNNTNLVNFSSQWHSFTNATTARKLSESEDGLLLQNNEFLQDVDTNVYQIL